MCKKFIVATVPLTPPASWASLLRSLGTACLNHTVVSLFGTLFSGLLDVFLSYQVISAQLHLSIQFSLFYKSLQTSLLILDSERIKNWRGGLWRGFMWGRGERRDKLCIGDFVIPRSCATVPQSTRTGAALLSGWCPFKAKYAKRRQL